MIRLVEVLPSLHPILRGGHYLRSRAGFIQSLAGFCEFNLLESVSYQYRYSLACEHGAVLQFKGKIKLGNHSAGMIPRTAATKFQG
jgi:hypothetical protein